MNEFSVDLGDEGLDAIERLLAGAATAAALNPALAARAYLQVAGVDSERSLG